MEGNHVKCAMCLLIYFNMYANIMLRWLLIWVSFISNLNWTQRGWVQEKTACKNICSYFIFNESPFFMHVTDDPAEQKQWKEDFCMGKVSSKLPSADFLVKLNSEDSGKCMELEETLKVVLFLHQMEIETAETKQQRASIQV